MENGLAVIENAQIAEGQAALNITWSGQNGDFRDPIPVDASEEEIRNWASEAVREGDVPGIEADADVNFEDFVVERFPPSDDYAYSRVHLRPKTPFGCR